VILGLDGSLLVEGLRLLVTPGVRDDVDGSALMAEAATRAPTHAAPGNTVDDCLKARLVVTIVERRAWRRLMML
jgi:hypothetical protein